MAITNAYKSNFSNTVNQLASTITNVNSQERLAKWSNQNRIDVANIEKEISRDKNKTQIANAILNHLSNKEIERIRGLNAQDLEALKHSNVMEKIKEEYFNNVELHKMDNKTALDKAIIKATTMLWKDGWLSRSAAETVGMLLSVAVGALEVSAIVDTQALDAYGRYEDAEKGKEEGRSSLQREERSRERKSIRNDFTNNTDFRVEERKR